MKNRSSVYLLLLLVATGCSRQSGDQAHLVYSGRAMTHFADSTAALSAEEVLDIGVFKACDQDVPNLKISKANNWFRFVATNNSNEPDLAVSIHYTEIDRLNLYGLSNGRATLIGTAGQKSGCTTDDIQEGSYTFLVPLEAGHSKELLLQVSGHKQIHVPLIIDTPLNTVVRHRERNLLVGMFAGIMLVLTLYNLFVFLSTKDKAYLVYVFYILINGIGQLTLLGTTQALLWPGSSWLATNASVILVLLSIATGIAFTRLFIRTDLHARRSDKFMVVFYIAIAANLFVYLGIEPQAGFKMAQMLSGVCTFFLLYTAIRSTLNGSRQGIFFLVAWSTFLVGVLLFVLKDAGVLAYNALTVYAMPAGSAIEGILLSFGLADRINILRREKEASQAEALAAAQENARIIRDQNMMLENKVTERTHQLQESLDRLKETQSQLVEAEKLSSLGQLTAGIAHEINNPVNYIRSNIKPLRRDMEELLQLLEAYRSGAPAQETARLEKELGIDETVREVDSILSCMEEGADRTAEIVRGLRTFSRLDEDDMKPADVNAGLQSTLRLLAPQLKDRINLELDLRSSLPLECHPGRINQVFMNILNNAIQAITARHGQQGGHLLVRTEDADGHLMATIVDNGTGMSPTTRARVFEPFFTTKGVGEGTGLGLSIAHSIIEKHNGRIEVDSIEGEGTLFRVVLPHRQPQLLAKRA